jgi:hypothetical protein
MSFIRTVSLQCDEPGCDEEYEGFPGFLLDVVRAEAAEMDGWVYARHRWLLGTALLDLCPKHAEEAVKE